MPAWALRKRSSTTQSTAGKKFRLMQLQVAGDVAGAYTFKDNTAGTTIAVVYLAANVPYTYTFGNGIPSVAANNVLTCTGPAASHITGMIQGTEE